MINLYRQSDAKAKNKSLYTYNKSHTASMNLKIAADAPSENTYREGHKNSHRQHEEDRKSRSTHKYKKSLILQDTTIHLVKKNSDYYGGKSTNMGMSTERLSKEKLHKRSVDYVANRIKTEIDEPKSRAESSAMVEMNVDELKEMFRRLQNLRHEK